MTTQQTFDQLLQSLKKPLTINQFKSLSSLYTIIDTRLQAQTTGLIKGSYWFPDQALYYSWLPLFIPQQSPFLFICDRSSLDQILQRFVLMGYFNCMGYNCFDMKHYDGEMVFPLLRNWKQLGDTERKLFVDVRTRAEWVRTGVPRKAMLVELETLDKGNQQKLNMLKQIQHQKLIIVNCQSGQRVKLASSILFRHGISNICLIQDINDFPQLGIKMQTLAENQKYWREKGERWNQISSQEENLIQKQQQSQNMNRMAVQECYEECLKQHPEKTEEQCRLECYNSHGKKFVRKPQETTKLQHSFNRNQLQASKQHITHSRIKQTQLYHHQQQNSLLYKKALQSFSFHNYEQSLNNLNRITLKNYENAQLYIAKALCQSKLGHKTKAYDDYNKVLELDHLNYVAYFDLASMKLNQNQASKQDKIQALSYMKKSLSCLYIKRALNTQGEQDIDRALELNPQNIEALLLKGSKHCENEQFDKSLELLSQIRSKIITDSKNYQQITQLFNQLRQKLENVTGSQQKQDINPEVEKPQRQQLKKKKEPHLETKKQQLLTSEQLNEKDIDEQIDSRVKEWNNLYQQVEGQKGSQLKKLEGLSGTTNHTIWLIN